MVADWVQLNAYSGVGPTTIEVRMPSWKGRQERESMIPFVKAGTDRTIIVNVVQKGVSILGVVPNAVTFPPEGGSRTITVSTNAESINVVLSSVSEQFPKAEISTMKIMDTVIDVNGTGLDYGVPGDPGADGLYQVVFTLVMPENQGREPIREKFVINNETVNISQPATNVPYLDVDRELVLVGPESSSELINIDSNVKYKIRVKECQGSSMQNSITVTPVQVVLEKEGDPQHLSIQTSKPDMDWEIKLKNN